MPWHLHWRSHSGQRRFGKHTQLYGYWRYCERHARLERANRVYGTQILVSETTANAVGSEFEMREIDTISVKGKTETTRVFELMSAAGQLSEEMVRLRERYDQARRGLHCSTLGFS